MMMRSLPSYRWYLISALLIAIGRWSLLIFFGLSIAGAHGGPPSMAYQGIVPVFLVAATCALAAFAIALVLRCPSCGKRLMIAASERNPEARRVTSLSFKDRARDFLLPNEVFGRHVRCARCGTDFLLRNET